MPAPPQSGGARAVAAAPDRWQVARIERSKYHEPFTPRGRARQALRGQPESMPLRRFDGHVFGAVDKNKLAVVKIHHVVADLDADGGELGDLGFQVVDGKAYVVESDLVELGDVGVGDHLRMMIGQKLHLGVRVLDRQRDLCSASMPSMPM